MESDYAACVASATSVVLSDRNSDDLTKAAREFLIAEYSRWQNDPGESEPE